MLSLTTVLSLSIILILLLLVYLVNRRWYALIFFLSLFFTEFYWIKIFGVNFKIFYGVSIFTFLIFTLPRLHLIRSKIAWIWFLFFLYNTFLVLILTPTYYNIRRLILFFMLFSISVNLYQFLKSKILDLDFIYKLILWIMVIHVFVGIIQISLFKLLGINLGIIPLQKAVIADMRFPGIFSEGDNSGKVLAAFILLLFPWVFYKNKKDIKWFFFLIAGLLINMTRSAIISAIGAFAVGSLLFNYLGSRTIIKGILILILAAVLSFPLMSYLGIQGKFVQRIQDIVQPHEIVVNPADSIQARIVSVKHMISKISTNNPYDILLGIGWGSGYGSSSLFVNVLVWGGIFSLFLFILIVIFSLYYPLSLRKMLPDMFYIGEGLFMAILVSYILDTLSSDVLYPAFWVDMGLIMYIEDLLYRKLS